MRRFTFDLDKNRGEDVRSDRFSQKGQGMRLLDLYCGEGLAAWGYWRSSRFSEIVGIDINPEMSTRYSFNFICGDCRLLTYDFLMSFDFIHASPPCQAYSKITPDKSKHLRLIAATHLMLVAAGLPYVIENVEGSGIELRPNLVMNGLYFGLPSNRRRYFHVSGMGKPKRLLAPGTALMSPQGDSLNRREMIEAMGLDLVSEKRLPLLTLKGMEQGIPPIFTKTIAEMVIHGKFLCGSRGDK